MTPTSNLRADARAWRLANPTARADNLAAFHALTGQMPIGGDPLWITFLSGMGDADAEIAARKRVEYRVDEFLAKLTALCAEYEASISSGCGCCGAGLVVRDFETPLEIPGSP